MSRLTPTFRVSRPAFTLVELLVVIAVIALLVALLLPVLGSARDQARLAICLSNQRQIALNAINYSVVSNGVIPPAMGWGPESRNPPPQGPYSFGFWGNHTAKAMMDAGSYAVYNINRYSIPVLELIAGDVDYNTWPAESSKVSYCAADKPWTAQWYRPEPGWWASWGQRQDSYAINFYLTHGKVNSWLYHNYGGALGPPEAGPGMVYYRFDQVKSASNKVLFAETHYSGVAGAVWLFTQTTPYGTWGCRPMVPITTAPWAPTGAISYPRHPKGFTVSFLDGHAQVIAAEATPGPWYDPVAPADVATMNSYWVP